MLTGVNLGDGKVLTVNPTAMTIVFAVLLIILVTTVLFISANIANIAKTLEQLKESLGTKDQ